MLDQEGLIKLYRISKPHIKDNSITQYIITLKNYYRLATNSSQSTWSDWDWLSYDENILKDVKSLASKRNYYNSILPLIKSFSIQKIPGTDNLDLLQEQVLYGTAIQNLNKQVKEQSENNIISEKKQEKYEIKFEQVEELVNKLRFKKLFQNSLILFLMCEYKFRNEISSFKHIKLMDFKKLSKEDINNNNYIVIGTKKTFISRSQFKTDKIHGTTKTDITNKQLIRDLKKYCKTLDDEIMFRNSDGHQYTNEAISQKVGRMTKEEFGISLGTSSINSLYLASLDKNTINKLIELSKSRGTSVNVLVSHYFNDV